MKSTHGESFHLVSSHLNIWSCFLVMWYLNSKINANFKNFSEECFASTKNFLIHAKASWFSFSWKKDLEYWREVHFSSNSLIFELYFEIWFSTIVNIWILCMPNKQRYGNVFIKLNILFNFELHKIPKLNKNISKHCVLTNAPSSTYK